MNADDLVFAHRYIPCENAAHAPTLLLLHGTGGDENALDLLHNSV